MRKFIIAFGIILYLVSMQSCVSTTAFQTARVTEAGDYGYSGGILLPNYSYEGSGEDLKTDYEFPAVDLRARYGLINNLDVGGHISLIGSSGLDVKYQYYGDSESLLAAAAGFDISYLSIDTNGETAYQSIDYTIPLYFSIHPSEFLGIYLSPRYSYRNISIGNGSFIGAVGGVRIGKRVAGFVEYAFMASTNNNWSDHTQLNIGIGVGIN